MLNPISVSGVVVVEHFLEKLPFLSGKEFDAALLYVWENGVPVSFTAKRLGVSSTKMHDIRTTLAPNMKMKTGRKSRFTESDRIEIRELRRSGLSKSQIAKQYGVSDVTIHYVLNPRTIEYRRDHG